MPMKNRILFIRSQCVNKQSQDFACHIERFFRTQFPWQLQMNMIKALWWIFQHCLGTFTILLLEASSKTGLFRHLSGYIFRVRVFEDTKSMRNIFLFRMFRFSSTFQKWIKMSSKSFLFLRKLPVNWSL